MQRYEYMYIIAKTKNKMPVQSVVIPKRKFTLAAAKKWITSHGYKVTFHGKEVDITPSEYRFRQQAVKRNADYRTKTLPLGVLLIVEATH